jgi:hypothetical protein
MDIAIAIPAPRLIDAEGLGDLFRALLAEGYHVIARLLIIAANCTEPGETCLCASMGTGPGTDGGDLALTELLDERGHRFLVDVGSQQDADLLGQVRSGPGEKP